MNQDVKRDDGKPKIHLVPMQIVRDIAEVRDYGVSVKYKDKPVDSWKEVEFLRLVDAMLRHTLAFAEDMFGCDAESGIPHYKHAECNWAFISEMMKDMEAHNEQAPV